jgi:SAM-dependent methyltransferase
MPDPQMRIQLNAWLEGLAVKLNLRNKEILEVGLAGDEKPSGSYRFFGKGNKWKTLDIDPKWEPDIVADICDSGLESNSFDLVIMTQTIEHIWDFRKALSEIHRLTRKYAIIDCPFMYVFHQDKIRSSRPWQEWDDYWRFTPAGFKKLLEGAGFRDVKISFMPLLSLALCQK